MTVDKEKSRTITQVRNKMGMQKRWVKKSKMKKK
jgi:hypothetical protein